MFEDVPSNHIKNILCRNSCTDQNNGFFHCKSQCFTPILPGISNPKVIKEVVSLFLPLPFRWIKEDEVHLEVRPKNFFLVQVPWFCHWTFIATSLACIPYKSNFIQEPGLFRHCSCETWTQQFENMSRPKQIKASHMTDSAEHAQRQDGCLRAANNSLG